MRQQAREIQPRESGSAPQPPSTTPPSFSARALLEQLSRPRLTGSSEAAEVAGIISSRLAALGYEVTELPFVFSSWPGRFGVSLAGLCCLAGALGATWFLQQGHPGVALVVLLTLIVVVGGIAVLARPAMGALRFGRVQGVNLLAHLPGQRPRCYLMAHRDSKSQPIPLAFRGPAIVLVMLSWIALTVITTAAVFDPIWNRPNLTLLLGGIAAGCAVLLIFCWVNNRSPGALDNASGVATLLGVAERLAGRGDVAFIFTDAEELGLAGAHAIAGQLPASFGVINVDGVDDDGDFHLVERFGWPRKRGAAPHLAAALLGAADQLEMKATRRDVPLGLLLDHIAVVRAGIPSLTLMRGRLRSMLRVHRPADNLDRLQGHGVERAVDLLVAALDRLRQLPH